VTELDDADRALLRRLQENAGVSVKELADVCGLSVASVQRRLKRLRSEKIIERDTAVLNGALLGQAMTFVVLVELERERSEFLHAFQMSVRNEPRVQQCYMLTGEIDFMLVCVCRDMPAFEALTKRLFFENPNVKKVRTSVVLGRSKVGLSIPI
jgi:DNA-binding Lrp family transcriptional regulator